MLTEQTAAEFVDSLDLRGVPFCPLCLFDLAWALHTEKTRTGGLLRWTCAWMWEDIGDPVEEAVLCARMSEVAHAEDALRDVRERGAGGLVARRIVLLLARRLAAEFGDEG
jgi:hypothetical protein